MGLWRQTADHAKGSDGVVLVNVEDVKSSAFLQDGIRKSIRPVEQNHLSYEGGNNWKSKVYVENLSCVRDNDGIELSTKPRTKPDKVRDQ